MPLSSLAETLADYARSEAKRSSNESAGTLHLLAAMRRWHEEGFDQRYPGLCERVRKQIAAGRGSAISPPDLLPEVIERLETVKNVADAWSLADLLVADFDLTEVAVTDEVDSPPETSRRTKAEAEETTTLDTDPLPFAITEGLISRAAGITGIEAGEMASLILTAAHSVALQILTDAPEGLFDELCANAGATGVERVDATNADRIVATIASSSGDGAGRVATQVALALVEVAEWSAARDAEVTPEETDRIDTVRLALREQLADRIDAESEAMVAFEQKFAHLVGMESVKTEIRRRVDFLVVNKRRQKRGMSTSPQRMHMAFVGTPGTGKTTVARLYGELLHDLGLLPTRNFVETDRSGLVGTHVGQTDEKTSEVINQADGGILFIDEAYALDDGYASQKGFGEEATNVIVKQMEDRRDRLVVILAGYKKETLEYMNLNPGLLSRVPTIVDFPDYSDDELMVIADRIAERRDLSIDDDAKPALRKILSRSRNEPGFGNARTVENILESAQRNVVNRTSPLGNLATEKELRTILTGDIPETAPPRTKVIGFGPATYL